MTNMQISVEVQMTVSKLYLFVLLKSPMITPYYAYYYIPQVVVARPRARLG